LVFSENDHLYFAENFEEFVFCSFVGSQMILIPFEQSVKWSALITLVKKLLILHLLNKQSQEHFESLVQKELTL
jgi:isochorismate synthase